MEYEIELTPFQILLGLEMYSFVNQIFNFKIPDQEIQKIKNGIKIISINKEKYLTRIAMNYVSKAIRTSFVERINFYLKKNMLEKLLKTSYKKIIDYSYKSSILPLCDYLPIYLKEVSNTLLIDIISEHLAGLIQYIIKIGLRKEHSEVEIEMLSNNFLNNLLVAGSLSDIIVSSKFNN